MNWSASQINRNSAYKVHRPEQYIYIEMFTCKQNNSKRKKTDCSLLVCAFSLEHSLAYCEDRESGKSTSSLLINN